MDALRRRYAEMSAREQRMVLFGAVVAAVLLILAIVMPIDRAVARAHERIERKQADLDWLRQVGPSLASAPQTAAPAANESLLVLVDRSAREAGLGAALTGSQPSGDGAMRTQFQKAEFDRLIGWMGQLAQQHGVRAESATFDAGDAPGVVNAVVVLRQR